MLVMLPICFSTGLFIPLWDFPAIAGNDSIAATPVLSPATYTGVSANTNRSIYLPGEVVGLEIVLLNREGSPVTGACVNLSITAPDNVTRHYSTHDGIIEIGGGVYVAAFDHTGVEGRYCVNASAMIEGEESFFDTYFLVQSEYDFDIIRTAEGVIDPTVQDRFDVAVDIISHTNAGTVVIRERLPSVFTVFTDADVALENNTAVLTWQRDLVDGRTSVNYSYSVPMECPRLYELGPMEIGYDDRGFVEAGVWYVAVDPAQRLAIVTMTEPSSDPDIVTGQTFNMSCYWTRIYTGSSPPNVNLYFEYDQGTGTWVQIPASGKLNTSDDNPETGTTHDTTYTITVTSSTAGVYSVRCRAHDTSNSIIRYSETQTVTVSIVNATAVETPRTYNSSLIEKTVFEIGENVTIRANVTDADGASDISAVNITITAPNSTVMVDNATMTNVSDITNGYIYQYNYTTMPIDSTSVGTWTVVVYAKDTSGYQTTGSTTFQAFINYLTLNINATELYVNDTVLVYGTVTNLSDNTAVNGAAVNISITYPDGSLANFTQKTTNSQGEYNTTYTVSPGDPLGVYTVDVNTSDGLGNITTNSTTFEVIINPNIRVVTNRYVILDDPDTSGLPTSGEYARPSANNWGNDYWKDESTTIRGYALVMNETGMPANGTTVTFTLKYPNGTTLNISPDTTDSHGTASYSFDLNEKSYYGEWTLNASATVDGIPLNDTTIFIYNWWGCADCHGVDIYTTVTSKSPYLEGYDKVHQCWQHDSAVENNDCTVCHRSYGTGSAGLQYPHGDHNTTNVCQDCHGNGTWLSNTATDGIPDMLSCYDQECHAGGAKWNNNLTEIGTLLGEQSIYSGDPVNPLMAHSYYDYSYGDLWDMPADVPAPTDFDSGLNNSSNTWGPEAGDDGWDWTDDPYLDTNNATWEDEEWVSAGDNPFASNGAIMIELDTYSGGHDSGELPGGDLSGAFGIQIDVTTDMHAILSGGGVAEVSFKYGAWDTDLHYSSAGSNNGCEEEGVIKARFGNSSTMHWLGTDTADTLDSDPDVAFYRYAMEDSNYVRVVYNVTDYITGAGWYYLELGAIQQKWDDPNEEGRRFYFDDVELSFSTTEEAVSCILCHNPMHNITNPCAVTERNSYTEDSHCTVCHKAMKKHDGEVGCTVCHSQDAHIKAYFNFNGTYSGDPGDCSVCHEDELFDTILSQPKAGLYSGPTLNLLIPSPSTHSDNESAGQLWGDYWYNDEEMCIFCHSKSYHTIETAGRIEDFKGDSIYNGLISADSFWCGKCHYVGNPDYLDMVNAFNSSDLEIPPEITGNNTYWDNGSIILEEEPYINHSEKQYDVNYSDDECKDCHGLMSMTHSDQFQHKVLVGSIGGSDCVDPLCHGSTAKINNAPYVNYTILKEGIHRNLNSNVSYTQTLTDLIDKACWACHANGSETDHRGLKPGKEPHCKDCHFINRTTQGDDYNRYYPVPNPNVTEHTEYSIDITTNVSGNGSCYGCHNNSINQSHNDPDVTDWSMISHYGTNETLMTETTNSSNCTYCHIDTGQTDDNLTLRQMWGTPKPINSSNVSDTHNGITEISECYQCHVSTSVMPYSFHQLEMRRDQVLPGVNITSPINTTYTSNSIYLNYTVNKTTWNEYYNLNDMENITLIGDTVTESGDRSSIISVPNGNHTITVYAEDVSGNLGHDVVNFSVSAPDTEPPNATITDLSDPVAGNRTINATITDNSSTIINATYYIDNSTWGGTYDSGNITMDVVDGAWDELAENVTKSFAVVDLADGNYTIHVRGQDQGSLWGDYDSLNFTVAGYGVTITIAPESQSVLAGSDAQYTVTVTNTGSNATDTIDLALSNTNDFEFETNLTQTSFTLASGASDTAVLIVTARPGVDEGASTTTTITGTSQGWGSKTDSDDCTTMVMTTPPGLMVTTNRYVILDDPASWGSDDWGGENTAIRAYILVMNATGMPDIGAAVNITLKNPDSATINTTDTTTDESGVAAYLFDLNDQNNWGTWIINVTTSTGTALTSFKYNQWGCSRCHYWYRNPAGYGMVSKPNSPYMEGYDRMHGAKKHRKYVIYNYCLYCHQSYGTGTAPSQYPDGYHKYEKRCQDCHNNDFTSGDGIPDLPSCYSCHPEQNTNLTSLTTVNSSVTDDEGHARTNYSDTPPTPTGNPRMAHDSAHNVSCILCHSPMHTITKPNTTVGTNAYTEDLHCIACHKPGRAEHNGTVNCTICHSQDAHRIMFFDGTGSFSQGTADAGNCTTCHQDGKWAAILSSSDVSTYTGSSAPSVPKPLRHSDNVTAGHRWNDTGYWTDDQSACEYCHSKTYHSSNALGRPSRWDGNNTINSSVDANSTWCAGCHYVGYESGSENYTYMVNKFDNAGLPIPPEITTGKYAPNTTPGFYEHVFTDDYSDQLCRECHEKKVDVSSHVTPFMHNLTMGDCEYCHYDEPFMANKGKSDKFVNSTMYNASVHGNRTNIWCWDCHITSNHPDPEYYWKWCECCHSYQTDPIGESDRHNVTTTPSTYSVGGTNVLDITDCTTCHNAATYNASVDYYTTYKCRYCHVYPDKGNRTSQEWY